MIACIDGVVGVTVQDAGQGDTTTSIETLIAAAEQIEAVVAYSEGPKELVADKGYHSNQALAALEAVGVRSYISEPDRGDATGRKILRHATRCIETAGGYAARAANA